MILAINLNVLSGALKITMKTYNSKCRYHILQFYKDN